MKIISIFNNKGGVGKTTYMFHIAHMLAHKGKRILVVDLDSQANFSAYALTESQIEQRWSDKGNSIWRILEPVYKGIGDIKKIHPTTFNKDYENLYLTCGDLNLSNYEDILGDSWSSARGGQEQSIRIQSAIYRYIIWAARELDVDIVLTDLGPNLGALNRCSLGASDYFIVPVSPDLFSIRGIKNLANKLEVWRDEWNVCNSAWKSRKDSDNEITMPSGKPIFLGYVTQQHNQRSDNPNKMTKGWSIFGDRIHEAINNDLISQLRRHSQVYNWVENNTENYDLGKIPNLHSLVPYSLEAKKPIFDCTAKDGLKGEHISKARSTIQYFEDMANKISNVSNTNAKKQ